MSSSSADLRPLHSCGRVLRKNDLSSSNCLFRALSDQYYGSPDNHRGTTRAEVQSRLVAAADPPFLPTLQPCDRPSATFSRPTRTTTWPLSTILCSRPSKPGPNTSATCASTPSTAVVSALPRALSLCSRVAVAHYLDGQSLQISKLASRRACSTGPSKLSNPA